LGCRAEWRRSGRRDPVLTAARISVGIGGWDFAPWRGRFYPAGLPKTQELAYASGRLTSIEINATFYRTQTRESFTRWRDTVPDGFVFSVKAPRAASYGKDPAQVRLSIDRFLNSGVTELGAKLGPILWQFPANRRFDPAQVGQFLDLLPVQHDGVALRHVLEAKHESFADPAYAALLSAHRVADCVVESAAQSARLLETTDLLYLRLQRTEADAREGYASAALDTWHRYLTSKISSMSRGIHVYFISGAKERAPDAACALLRRFGYDPIGGWADNGWPDAVSDRDVRQAREPAVAQADERGASRLSRRTQATPARQRRKTQ
jgi:uncharacterized protein YecE (DUF72 family)